MMEKICKKIREIRTPYYYYHKEWKARKNTKDLIEAEYRKNKNFFVNDEWLSQFDFSNDCYNDIYMEEKDPIRKYLLYQVVSKSIDKRRYENAWNFKEADENKRERQGIRTDPDSKSILLQILYKDLYDLYKKDFCENDLFTHRENDKDNKNIQGDTMNSVQSALNSYIEMCLEKKYSYFKEIRKNPKAKSESYYPVSYGYFLELYYRDETKAEICDGLEAVNAPELMKTYHTLGNFIVIPTDCNEPRGKCILKDFWDLTLACIYNWYSQIENREDRIVKVIDNKCLAYNIGMIFTEESNLKKYIKWLDLFGTWDSFVENNCLGDRVEDGKNDILVNFVEKKSDGHYGRPKELWPGHFAGEVMPSNAEEYKEFFTNSSKYIINRGIIMHDKLKTSKTK